jgi:pilus assembly protein CpaC
VNKNWLGFAVLFSMATSSASALANKPDASAGAQSAAQDQKISLAIGETKTINVGDIKEYSEGTPGIVLVRATPDKFILVGQRAGSSSLLLIKNSGAQVTYVINVFAKDPALVKSELAELLDGYTGLRVRQVGPRLFVEGGVATQADQERVKQIAALYSGQVESLVTVGTGATDRNLNIRLDVFFVQYNKSSGYNVGISWPGVIGGQFAKLPLAYNFVSGVATAQAVLSEQPLPGLDIASNHGWAKILRQATIVTTNGNQATFSNGGELNFKVQSGFGAQIQPVTFGTNVTVLPRFDPSTQNIEVKVDADVSDLTAGAELPGRQTSKLSTLVFMKLGQSLVISGIRSRSQRRNVEGIPILSEIPVLGVLFGSHVNQSEDVEGAVVIVPSVVEPVSKSGSEFINEALAQYEGFSGDMDDVNTYPKVPPARRGKVK